MQAVGLVGFRDALVFHAGFFAFSGCFVEFHVSAMAWQEALRAFRRGEFVMVMDSDEREDPVQLAASNTSAFWHRLLMFQDECDLVFSAEMVTVHTSMACSHMEF